MELIINILLFKIINFLLILGIKCINIVMMIELNVGKNLWGINLLWLIILIFGDFIN